MTEEIGGWLVIGVLGISVLLVIGFLCASFLDDRKAL